MACIIARELLMELAEKMVKRGLFREAGEIRRIVATHMYNQKWRARAAIVSQPMTAAKEAQIQRLLRNYPDMPQHVIANKVGVNEARVGEQAKAMALNGGYR